jgi:thioesterase domain-containing protein
MLLPIQTSGDEPPLFFVHSLHGVMPLGPSFAAMFGSEQPLCAIHADGIEGRSPDRTHRRLI